MKDYTDKLLELGGLSDILKRSGLEMGYSLDIEFDPPSRRTINKLSRIYSFLSDEYPDFIKKYNGIVVGNFLLFCIDEGIPISAILNAESSDKKMSKFFKNNCPIGHVNNSFICLGRDGRIYLISRDNYSVKEVASSFAEFMNDCVFGERYLEFAERDEVYEYLQDIFPKDQRKAS